MTPRASGTAGTINKKAWDAERKKGKRQGKWPNHRTGKGDEGAGTECIMAQRSIRAVDGERIETAGKGNDDARNDDGRMR